jgi:NAD(P)-dependent dehydrogenase (short-subunit alcohol dehydrogenase family)
LQLRRKEGWNIFDLTTSSELIVRIKLKMSSGDGHMISGRCPTRLLPIIPWLLVEKKAVEYFEILSLKPHPIIAPSRATASQPQWLNKKRLSHASDEIRSLTIIARPPTIPCSQNKPMPPPLPVLLTGGTGGIGRAVAQLLARSASPRFAVHVLSRHAARARAAVLALPSSAVAAGDGERGREQEEEGATHAYAVGDVASPAFWRGLARGDVPFVRPRRKGGGGGGGGGGGQAGGGVPAPRPALLVNAAGAVREGPFARASEDGVRAALDANLLATVWGCRHMLRALRSHAPRRSDPVPRASCGGEGAPFTPSIVNVASVLARQGGDRVAAYAAAKGGVLGE